MCWEEKVTHSDVDTLKTLWFPGDSHGVCLGVQERKIWAGGGNWDSAPSDGQVSSEGVEVP